jgi:DNA gyrase subunit B
VEGDSAGGCFPGDTRVALADGRNITFRELAMEHEQGKKNYCYTIKDDGGIGIAAIENPRRTKQNAEVMKITLDNGEEVTSTPDHRFLLRDRAYKRADNLTPADSLMPLYRKVSEKGETTKKQWTPEFRAKRMIAYNRTYKERALGLLRTIFDGMGTIPPDRYEALRRERNDKTLLCYPTVLERFFGGSEKRLLRAVERYNHKIVRVERLAGRMDVYDLEVEGTHNFALAAGVFVHNSAKTGRNRKFQAILPLRGKILNIEKARLDKALAFQEIRSLVIALGTAIADDFDIEKLRYHKVIIATDADVDGKHIATLLLTLFYRYFPQLIERGHIYIAQPPLYKIQSGKKVAYVYSDDERDRVVAELRKSAPKQKEPIVEETAEGETAAESETGEQKIRGLYIQRYKGLGEMNPDQLFETTMDPEKRTLKQITVEDAEEANKMFDVLMGTEVAPRKLFIQTHATKVKELDI